MKSLLVVLVCVAGLSCFSIAGCGGNETNEVVEPTAAPALPPEQQQSYEEAMRKGMKK